MRKIGILCLGLCCIGGILSAQEITEKNWMNHPAIVEIRKIYAEVEKLADAGKLETIEKDFQVYQQDEFITMYGEWDKSAPIDPGYWLRKLIFDINDPELDFRWEATYYYEKKLLSDGTQGRPRFIFALAESKTGARVEYRLYFDAVGKILWENRRLVSGTNDTLPKSLPTLLMEDHKMTIYNQSHFNSGD